MASKKILSEILDEIDTDIIYYELNDNQEGSDDNDKASNAKSK